MVISQDQLKAFYEVSRHKSFTKAAYELGLTQSALSHRIRNLEEQLETTLFVREPSGIRLTESGSKLLEFCRVQSQMETELLADIVGANQNELKGHLRIGGTSSLMWSVVVPALTDLLSLHPNVQFEFMEREIHELPELLKNGSVDFIITSGKIEKANFERIYLGDEINVLIETKKKLQRIERYLDHDSNDQVTLDFLKLQGIQKSKINRCFMDNINGIIAGVEAGLGKAVVPQHLLKNLNNSRIVPNMKELRTQTFLYLIKQPFYSKLHNTVVKELTQNVSSYLNQ
ncbi:MAG: LysR family transcriptional regulator [Bdellovibrionales bacterium]